MSKLVFNGKAYTRPIPYEDIAVGRDVVYLVHLFRHEPENVGIGASPTETLSYTGMLTERNGDRFTLAYFSLTTDAAAVLRPHDGNTLADPGGKASAPMTLDRDSMTFWKMGELYVGANETLGSFGPEYGDE